MVYNESNYINWHYIEQVADFIMKNADVQFTGAAISDPFTGVCVCLSLFIIIILLYF